MALSVTDQKKLIEVRDNLKSIQHKLPTSNIPEQLALSVHTHQLMMDVIKIRKSYAINSPEYNQISEMVDILKEHNEKWNKILTPKQAKEAEVIDESDLARGHGQLIEHMQSLGYQAMDEGICFGVTQNG